MIMYFSILVDSFPAPPFNTMGARNQQRITAPMVLEVAEAAEME